MKSIVCMGLLTLSTIAFAETKEIAITLDDLPLVASHMNTPGNIQRSTERFDKIIEALKTYQVPATGFVIGGAIEKGQWAFLEKFKEAGFSLGSHTYSHFNLNSMSSDKYIADVDRADKKLAPIFTSPKYFRYPYLAEGANKEAKQKVVNYLTAHGYTIAPVTIDSKDYEFNEQLYHVPYRQREAYIHKLKTRYLNFVWNQTLKAEKRSHGAAAKQILLLHSNLLNSYVLADLLQMYKDHGYTFISLQDALKNPAPELKVMGGPKEEKQVNPMGASPSALNSHPLPLHLFQFLDPRNQ
jgi:peptidoglycan/xylan/chitin deacetylase (PgdA/CDA1 family)